MPGRLFAVLTLAAHLATSFAVAQSLDEILAGNLETRGGPDAFEAVRTARLTGSMTTDAEEVPIVLELTRPPSGQATPEKRRLALQLQGQWGFQAFDGEQGWQYFPFFGIAEPAVLPEDELRQLLRETDVLDGPLVRSVAKGYTVELEGRDRIEGTDAFKLRVTAADGSFFHSYLDTDHYLEFKRKGTAVVRGRELRFETTIGNYKPVGGLYVPHLVQTGAQGEAWVQTLKIETVELNVELDDERFSSPHASSSSPAEKGGR